MRSVCLLAVLAVAVSAADWEWKMPPRFPVPAVPADNPMTSAKVELGRHLFYDKRLSVNGKTSCATCHRQELAFTDGRARAVGATGQSHTLSSMSLVNVGYATALTWAHPNLTSLEEQASIPMMGDDPVEMGMKGREAEFLKTARDDRRYRALFRNAFADKDPVTLRNVTLALAAFERSIVSVRSPYDRYRWGYEMSAMSESAKRGEIVFSSGEKGGCFQCHGGWNFTGGQFLNNGVSGDETAKFRTPTLRNIAVTAPYMHDGSIATLEGVIDRYAARRKLQLTAQEKQDLIEFLKSLTDEEMLRDPRWSDPWPLPDRSNTVR